MREIDMTAPRRPRSALATVRAGLQSLQASDARVAELILQEPDAIVYRSVSEVAAAAGVSSATVVRCAQKLGFSGFHDLKLALAQERPQLAEAAEEPGGDERISTLRQVVRAGAQAVRDADALVDPEDFDATVSALAAASHVLFLGVGTSAPLAQDAAYRFSTIGLHATAPADIHVQHVQARLLGKDDVCVAISHTGSTREIVTTAQAAAGTGATTVAITSFTSSPLTELVDHVIVAGTREVSFRLEAMASRLAHLAMLDALLVAVSGRDEERARRALGLYSDVLSEHRF